MTDYPRFVSEALTETHVVEEFDCGKPGLNDWLRSSARHARDMGTARTFVWADPATQVVVAYYAVAPHVVARDSLPASVGRGSPDQIPAILLARLALDRSLHGQSLGGQLLLDALGLIVVHARGVGGRLVLVDAIDDQAARFYRHHGLEPLPGNPGRLVQKLSRVASTLGIPWP